MIDLPRFTAQAGNSKSFERPYPTLRALSQTYLPAFSMHRDKEVAEAIRCNDVDLNRVVNRRVRKMMIVSWVY